MRLRYHSAARLRASRGYIAGTEDTRQTAVEPVLAFGLQWNRCSPVEVRCAMQRSISIWLIAPYLPYLVWPISKVAPLPNAPRAGRFGLTGTDQMSSLLAWLPSVF